jgi:hypothetical protein
MSISESEFASSFSYSSTEEALSGESKRSLLKK